jgi:hypothetical protein
MSKSKSCFLVIQTVSEKVHSVLFFLFVGVFENIMW